MTIDDILSAIRHELFDVKRTLMNWTKANDDILNYKPLDGGWSGLQILEHISLTSHFLLLIIDKASDKARRRAVAAPINMDWSNYELAPNLLKDVGVHKSFVWIRPDHMEPSGNISLIDVSRALTEQFDRCDAHLELLRKGEGILCRTTMTVNAIGKMDVYQYIYFLVLHAKRHVTQLEKNRLEFEM